jgi:alpha-glucosidase
VLLYGDELGLVDQDVPRERQRDPFGLIFEDGVSHDPARTPMPWNARVNSGFSTAPEERLWLPACTEYETINVEAQLADPGSMLNLYRASIALRKRSDALRLGAYAEHPAGDEHVLVFVRQLGAERKLVALNLSDEPRTVELAEAGEIVLASGLDRHGERVEGTLELRPAEGVVIATRG